MELPGGAMRPSLKNPRPELSLTPPGQTLLPFLEGRQASWVYREKEHQLVGDKALKEPEDTSCPSQEAGDMPTRPCHGLGGAWKRGTGLGILVMRGLPGTPHEPLPLPLVAQRTQSPWEAQGVSLDMVTWA